MTTYLFIFKINKHKKFNTDIMKPLDKVSGLIVKSKLFGSRYFHIPTL